MKTHTLFETNYFVVKNPPSFKKDLQDFSSGISIVEHEKGFMLYSESQTNPPSIIGVEDIIEHPEYAIAYFIQSHIREDQEVQIKFVRYIGESIDVTTSYYLVTPHAIHYVGNYQIFEFMRTVILPREVTCLIPTHNRHANRWIESGKRYLAVEEVINQNMLSYIIRHDDGMELAWSKENFNG